MRECRCQRRCVGELLGAGLLLVRRGVGDRVALGRSVARVVREVARLCAQYCRADGFGLGHQRADAHRNDRDLDIH